MNKHDIVTLQIDDISAKGQGIGRTEEGMAVFVGGALPGDTIRAELTKVKKRYAFGRLTEIVEESPDREMPLCSMDQVCGGCTMGRLNYDAQLALKEKHVQDALIRLGGLEDPVIQPIIPMDVPYRYRNKATMPVSTGGIITRKGGVVENLGDPAVGFYRSRSHEVVNCEDCSLQTDPVLAVAEALRQFMKEDNITGFDPRWNKGLMRHVIVRTAFVTGEVMVILVINGKGIPNAAKLISMLDEAVSSISYEEDDQPYSLESVIINRNKEPMGTIYGDKTEVLAGKGTIRESICGLEFEISPLSFYQVNPIQMVNLYDKVVDYANLQGGETILDLYCGAGTIGLWLLKDLRDRVEDEELPESAFASTRVLGIEQVKSAILDANRNAVLNNIVNARYVCGKAEFALPKLMGKPNRDGEIEDVEEGLKVSSVDVAIVDPPRAGCDEHLLSALVETEPERIVYVSCDPATLARDVKWLCNRGYSFVEATPVDMFPMTGHVEPCCLLKKRE